MEMNHSLSLIYGIEYTDPTYEIEAVWKEKNR